MRRLLFVLMLLMPGILPAQYAYRIRPVPALPATCNPLNGEVVQLTAGAGVSPGIYSCTATNTWRPAGFMGNQMVWNQGTLTASLPVISHTATWNNGAVLFTNIISNITDTASNGASLLMNLQVGGGTRFAITKAGEISSASNLSVGASSNMRWASRSLMLSSADAKINFTDQAGTSFTSLTLGPESAGFPQITVVSVAGQAQGILIRKGDGNNITFANLGAATNGTIGYCADCTIANPCAGGGTGALAKRLNGAWVCN